MWTTTGSLQHVDWSKARTVKFPELQPSTTAIFEGLVCPGLLDMKKG